MQNKLKFESLNEYTLQVGNDRLVAISTLYFLELIKYRRHHELLDFPEEKRNAVAKMIRNHPDWFITGTIPREPGQRGRQRGWFKLSVEGEQVIKRARGCLSGD